MEMITVWMLGWADPTVPAGETEAWRPVARALASQVKLQVLLPHNKPPVSLEKVTITDLDTVELAGRPMASLEPGILPFAPSPFPPAVIPLYGTPVYTGKQTGNPGQRQPGEAVRAGHPNNPGIPKSPPSAPPASLHAQVIDYARRVCRFAHGKNMDSIYAFHWQTYLAALELKLVTGKNLVLQVHALSQDRHLPDRLGWMLEVEKQIFEKADAILVDDDQLAEALIKEYGFAAAKLSVTDGGSQNLLKLLQAFRPPPLGLADQQYTPDPEPPRESSTWNFTGANTNSQTAPFPLSGMKNT